VSLPVLRQGIEQLERLIAAAPGEGPPVIAIEATGSLHHAWVAELDKTLTFLAEMDMVSPEGEGPTSYVCPMHPDVVSEKPGNCPECGMKLLPSALVDDATGHGHEHGAGHQHAHGAKDHNHAASDGIEWDDDMVEVNRMTTPSNGR
jgi:hypothetical protein